MTPRHSQQRCSLRAVRLINRYATGLSPQLITHHLSARRVLRCEQVLRVVLLPSSWFFSSLFIYLKWVAGAAFNYPRHIAKNPRLQNGPANQPSHSPTSQAHCPPSYFGRCLGLHPRNSALACECWSISGPARFVNKLSRVTGYLTSPSRRELIYKFLRLHLNREHLQSEHLPASGTHQCERPDIRKSGYPHSQSWKDTDRGVLANAAGAACCS